MRVVKQASSNAVAEGLVGRSVSFNQMLALAMRVAPIQAAVLLPGETGTGKELVARLLHEADKTARGPFVAVDCSGLSESLFESELFSYEKGAFTGALHRKTRLVESARGGTLFLEDVERRYLAWAERRFGGGRAALARTSCAQPAHTLSQTRREPVSA